MTSPETVEVPALRVVGFSIRTSSQAEAEASPGEGPIARAWQQFSELDLEKQVNNPHVSGEVVAVYHDYASDAADEFTLTIGLRVTALHQVPAGLVGVEIPFQTYARYVLTGTPEDVLTRTIPPIWNEINQDSSLERAYTYDLEVYRPGKTTDSLSLEVLVAIKSNSGS